MLDVLVASLFHTRCTLRTPQSSVNTDVFGLWCSDRACRHGVKEVHSFLVSSRMLELESCRVK
jgi:hypothetical protein